MWLLCDWNEKGLVEEDCWMNKIKFLFERCCLKFFY